MLTKLFKHNHRQRPQARPSTSDDMERSRRLGDLLTIPAGKLSNGLDDLSPEVLSLQGLRDVLTITMPPPAK